MKRTIITLLAGLPGLLLAAQEPWSLERCIRYGLEHNIDLRQQMLQADIRQAEYRQAQAAPLPRISAGIVQEYNWGRSVDMQELVIIRNKLTQSVGGSINASVTIFSGLSLHHGLRAAGQAAEAARQDTRQVREELTLDITRAYLQLMLAEQLETCVQENYSVILQQQERTRQLVEAGSHPKSALDEMAAQVAAEKAAVVDAGCRVRSAALELMQLMQLPDSCDFRIADSFDTENAAAQVPVLTEAQVENYLFDDPRIRSAEAVHTQMRYQYYQSLASFLPTLRLTAGYGTYFSSAGSGKIAAQIDENQNPSLSFQLEIPVFQALQAGFRQRISRLAREQARLDAEKTRSRIADEIRRAVIDAENSCQQFRSSEETLRAVRQLLEITEARYNLGAATALDYISARNNQLKALSDYLQAKWQYLFQLKLLERYIR